MTLTWPFHRSKSTIFNISSGWINPFASICKSSPKSRILLHPKRARAAVPKKSKGLSLFGITAACHSQPGFLQLRFEFFVLIKFAYHSITFFCLFSNRRMFLRPTRDIGELRRRYSVIRFCLEMSLLLSYYSSISIPIMCRSLFFIVIIQLFSYIPLSPAITIDTNGYILYFPCMAFK